MPPKIPQSLVKAVSPALLLLLLNSAALAQLGYSDLQAELGAGLTPTAGSRIVYVPEESSAWRYWTGDLGAPASDWKLNSFVEPAGWTTGQTSVGYGDADDNVELTGMEDNFTSVYLRHQFTVALGEIPPLLHLRLYVDDGAIVWLNGHEVARANVTTLDPVATDTATTTVNNASWKDFFIPATGSIAVEGANTIAIHALNGSIGSSDFSIDLELIRPLLDFGHVEATSANNYLPRPSPESAPAIGYEFLGSSSLTGKTFEIRSIANGVTFGQSGHASNVAAYSYYPTRPGNFLPHFRCWNASGFLSGELLQSGTTAPDASLTHVQNHSWIAYQSNFTPPITDAELSAYIRRFDYMNARDGVLNAVGLNNGSGTLVPPLWGSAYNAISVGVISGDHSRGGTVAGSDGPGRQKPDIVALGNNSATSYATANVSGTAALLLGVAYDRPELSGVFHPEVNKAIMMASASKDIAAGWSHSPPSQPLDPIYGSGELDAQHSYHLLVAGQQPASTPLISPSGWNYAELDPAAPASYTFVIPDEEHSTRCSAVLTWFRQFEENPEANNFATVPVLPDFQLAIHESSDGVLGTQLELSNSAVDNVEHVYLENLPAGEYTITVETDTLASYAIAWENRLEELPDVALSAVNPSTGDVTLDLTNLTEGIEYTLQYSTDLSTWSNLHTVTAGSDTEPYTQIAIPVGVRRGFYRIVWTP